MVGTRGPQPNGKKIEKVNYNDYIHLLLSSNQKRKQAKKIKQTLKLTDSVHGYTIIWDGILRVRRGSISYSSRSSAHQLEKRGKRYTITISIF